MAIVGIIPFAADNNLTWRKCRYTENLEFFLLFYRQLADARGLLFWPHKVLVASATPRFAVVFLHRTASRCATGERGWGGYFQHYFDAQTLEQECLA
ncbi:MAG: hypothetical protein P4L91_12865 [Burkholderiaceae bacterium]|nr:hypothetical protein [Burkholderiaceae bacterium]